MFSEKVQKADHFLPFGSIYTVSAGGQCPQIRMHGQKRGNDRGKFYESRGRKTQTKEDGTESAEDRSGKLHGSGDCAVFQSSICNHGRNRYASDGTGYQKRYNPACRRAFLFFSSFGFSHFRVFSVYWKA